MPTTHYITHPFQKTGTITNTIVSYSAPYVVALFFIFQSPISYSAEISASEQSPTSRTPTITAAANGVPVVNIATPNSNGLSHNQYNDFNVHQQGLILNNTNQDLTRSQLGGLITANPNLATTGPAGYILNEVVSSNSSMLQGVVEVHGTQAQVIIANPNGITCNGCGFINTPRVVLSTGVPVITPQGRFSALRVENGTITIGENGNIITGQNGEQLQPVSVFDLVSRRIRIEGPLSAGQELNLIVGRNSYLHQTGLITPLPPDPDNPDSVPDISIDSSLLGGMYANRIIITSTEQGAGINIQGQLYANTNNLTITAQGRLIANNIQARGQQGQVSLTSNQSISLSGFLYSANSLTLSAPNLITINDGAFVASGTNTSITTETLTIGSPTGTQGATLATGMMLTDEGLSQTNTGTLITTDIQSLAISNASLTTGVSLTLNIPTITLSQTSTLATNPDNPHTTLHSLQDITINTRSLTNTNALALLSGSLTIDHSTPLTLTGIYSTGQNLTITAPTITNNATLQVQNSIDLSATIGSFTNNGTIINFNPESRATFSSRQADFTNNGYISTAGITSIRSDQSITLSSNFTSRDSLTLNSSHSITINDFLYSANSLTLNAPNLITINDGAFVASGTNTSITTETLTIGSPTGTQGATLATGMMLTDEGLSQTNTGTLITTDIQSLAISNASLTTGVSLTLNIPTITLSQTSTLATNPDNPHTTLHSLQDITINTRSLTNINALALLSGSLTIDHSTPLTLTGIYSTGQNLTITAPTITNNAILQAQNSIDLSATIGSFTNNRTIINFNPESRATFSSRQADFTNNGYISTAGITSIRSDQSINLLSTFYSAGNLTINAPNLITINDDAFVASGLDLFISTAALTIGRSLGTQGATLATGFIQTDEGFIQTTVGNLTINTIHLTLTNATISSGSTLTLNAPIITLSQTNALTTNPDNPHTTLHSLQDITINTRSLTNTNALVSLSGSLTIDHSNPLTLTGIYSTGQNLTITAPTITNNATLQAQGSIDLSTTIGAFTNNDRIQSNQNIALTSAMQLINHSDVISTGNISLNAATLLHNRENATIHGARNVELRIGGLTTRGTITNAGTITGGTSTTNSDSSVTNTGSLTIYTNGSITNTGSINLSNGNINLDNDFVNSGSIDVQGYLSISGNIDSQLNIFTNSSDAFINADQGLTILANSLINHAEIGSRRGFISFRINQDITNKGLFYSGGSSSYLLDGSFTNTAATIISQGNLIIAGLSEDEQHDSPRATRIENSSGVIESYATSADSPSSFYGIYLAADTILNIRTTLELSSTSRSEVVSMPFTSSLVSGTRSDTTTTTTTTYEIDEATAESIILSPQGNISIITTDLFTNNASYLYAGHTLSISADAPNGTVENISPLLTQIEVIERTWRLVYRSPPPDPNCIPMAIADCLPMPDYVFEENDPIITTTITHNPDYIAVIEAGAAISIVATTQVINGGDRIIPHSPTSPSTLPASSARLTTPAAPQPIGPQRLTIIINSLIQQSALFTFIPNPTTPTTRSQSAITIDTPSSNPLTTDASLTQVEDLPQSTSSFLIETRSQFIDVSRYVSSDYFLNQLQGYNPDETIRRLGDAYAETRFILAQIYEQTKRHISLSPKDTSALITTLYDNAVQQQQALNLTAGIALTPEQISQLTKDIVWLEEKIVQGETVLVPVFYLSPSSTQEVRLNKPTIKAPNVDINAASLISKDGDIFTTDSLTITVENTIDNTHNNFSTQGSLSLSANNIDNTHGTISAGQNLFIAARSTLPDGTILPSGDILNSSGTISALGNTTLIANRIINKRTHFDTTTQTTTKKTIDNPDIKRSSYTTIETITEQLTKDTTKAAAIHAGGTLTIHTGLLANTHSTITSDGDISIIAQEVINLGQDLLKTTLTTDTHYQKVRYCSSQLMGTCLNYSTRWVKRNKKTIKAKSYDTTTAQALIDAGGNLTIQTTGDITNYQATLNSTKTLTLISKKDVINKSGTISAQNLYIAAQNLINDTLTQYFSFTDASSNQTLREASIISQEELFIDAKDSITSQGGTFKAGTSATLKAGNTISLSSVITDHTYTDNHQLGSYTEQNLIHHLATIDAGTNLTLSSDNTITINGTTLTSGNDLTITATNNINITSVQNQYYSLTTTKVKGDSLLLEATSNLSEQKQKQQTIATTFNAGGTLSITSQSGDISIKAAKLIATEDINLSATKGTISLLIQKDDIKYARALHEQDLLWQEAGEAGYNDQNLNYVHILQGGSLNLNANAFNIEYEKTGSFSQSIANLSSTPGLEWMNDLTNNPEVNWQEIDKQFNRWSSTKRQLSPEGAAIVATLITVFTAGAAAEVGIGIYAAAVATAVASQAAVTFINNEGKIGNTLDELGSKEGLRTLATKIALAVASNAISGTEAMENLNFGDTFAQRFGTNFVKGLVTTSVSGAISIALQGDSIDDFDNSLDDYLRGSIKTIAINALTSTIANDIGEARAKGDLDKTGQLLSHAGLGCLGAFLAEGDCASGALGAVIGEAIALSLVDELINAIGDDGYELEEKELNKIIMELNKRLEENTSQIVAISSIAGALIVGAIGGDFDSAYEAASNAAENNAIQFGLLVAFAIAGASLMVGDQLIHEGRKMSRKAWEDSGAKGEAEANKIVDVLSKKYGFGTPDFNTHINVHIAYSEIERDLFAPDPDLQEMRDNLEAARKKTDLLSKIGKPVKVWIKFFKSVYRDSIERYLSSEHGNLKTPDDLIRNFHGAQINVLKNTLKDSLEQQKRERENQQLSNNAQ